MDRRRRGKQPRRTVGRTVRRLWLAAAAALVITYAVLLRRATVSTEQPAALRAGVASSTTTAPPLILEDETEDEAEEQGGKALRIVGNELPAGLLNVVSEKEGGGIKTRVNEDVEEGGGTTAAPTTTAVQTAEEPDDEELSAEETEAVPGEDALQPLHEFTDTDALPVKGEAGDRSVEEDHLFSDASLFDGLMAGSEKKEAGEEEEEEADSAHGFTDASYFDQLAREADAPEEDEAMSAHLFTDASYFDGMAGAEPTEETVSQPAESTHQFSDASSFDNLGMASVEEPEEVPPAKFSRFDDSRLVQYVEPPSQAVPMEQRHDVIAGYDAAIEYLQNYSTPEGSGEQLFLFFVCSDANGTALDWKPVCADAKKAVYDVFAKSPSTNRLVTIYAGPEEAWQGPNMLKEDDDLRLKSIPTVMRWDGGSPGAKRSTYGMLIDESVLVEPFLRYLFRNSDQVDDRLAQPDVLTKEIVTVRGYEQYASFVADYKQQGESYPLFMILMSGRWKSNNRLWCPFSRQSELPLEYAFYAFAPRDARFLVVETYSKYNDWRNPDNAFKKDPELHPKGVPWFLRVFPEPGGELRFQRVKQRLYMLDSLRLVFQDSQ